MKSPKATIMYGDPVAFDNEGNPFAFKPVLYAKRGKLHSRAFAVIPTSTAQQARKLAAFFNLTPEKQQHHVAYALHAWVNSGGNWPKGDSLAEVAIAAITGGRT